MELRPKMRPPNPSAERTTESASKRTFCVSVTLRTQMAPSTSASTAIGSTSQNIQRQSSADRMMPDTVGPTAGATAITMEMTPIIRPRRFGGTIDRTVVNSSGIMIAVPDACTMRPASSMSKPGASAAMSVPAVNSDIAAR
jgi:hypothetical protein